MVGIESGKCSSPPPKMMLCAHLEDRGFLHPATVECEEIARRNAEKAPFFDVAYSLGSPMRRYGGLFKCGIATNSKYLPDARQPS